MNRNSNRDLHVIYKNCKALQSVKYQKFDPQKRPFKRTTGSLKRSLCWFEIQ